MSVTPHVRTHVNLISFEVRLLLIYGLKLHPISVLIRLIHIPYRLF